MSPIIKGQHPTQFDEEDEGMEEELAPGAFKRPKSAYKLARWRQINFNSPFMLFTGLHKDELIYENRIRSFMNIPTP